MTCSRSDICVFDILPQALFQPDGDAGMVLACVVIDSEMEAVAQSVQMLGDPKESDLGRWQGILWLLRKKHGLCVSFDCAGEFLLAALRGHKCWSAHGIHNSTGGNPGHGLPSLMNAV